MTVGATNADTEGGIRAGVHGMSRVSGDVSVTHHTIAGVAIVPAEGVIRRGFVEVTIDRGAGISSVAVQAIVAGLGPHVEHGVHFGRQVGSKTMVTVGAWSGMAVRTEFLLLGI